MRNDVDNYLEKWILDLVKSEYQTGNIPKEALYKFKERMDDFTEVTVKWIDDLEREHKIIYSARAYGKGNLSSLTPESKNSIFELENYYTLEIHTYVDDIKRSYSTRKIMDYDVEKVLGQLKHLDELKNTTFD